MADDLYKYTVSLTHEGPDEKKQRDKQKQWISKTSDSVKIKDMDQYSPYKFFDQQFSKSPLLLEYSQKMFEDNYSNSDVNNVMNVVAQESGKKALKIGTYIKYDKELFTDILGDRVGSSSIRPASSLCDDKAYEELLELEKYWVSPMSRLRMKVIRDKVKKEIFDEMVKDVSTPIELSHRIYAEYLNTKEDKTIIPKLSIEGQEYLNSRFFPGTPLDSILQDDGIEDIFLPKELVQGDYKSFDAFLADPVARKFRQSKFQNFFSQWIRGGIYGDLVGEDNEIIARSIEANLREQNSGVTLLIIKKEIYDSLTPENKGAFWKIPLTQNYVGCGWTGVAAAGSVPTVAASVAIGKYLRVADPGSFLIKGIMFPIINIAKLATSSYLAASIVASISIFLTKFAVYLNSSSFPVVMRKRLTLTNKPDISIQGFTDEKLFIVDINNRLVSGIARYLNIEAETTKAEVNKQAKESGLIGRLLKIVTQEDQVDEDNKEYIQLQILFYSITYVKDDIDNFENDLREKTIINNSGDPLNDGRYDDYIQILLKHLIEKLEKVIEKLSGFNKNGANFNPNNDDSIFTLTKTIFTLDVNGIPTNLKVNLKKIVFKQYRHLLNIFKKFTEPLPTPFVVFNLSDILNAPFTSPVDNYHEITRGDIKTKDKEIFYKEFDAFIISNICPSDPSFKETLYSTGTFASLLNTPFDVYSLVKSIGSSIKSLWDFLRGNTPDPADNFEAKLQKYLSEQGTNIKQYLYARTDKLFFVEVKTEDGSPRTVSEMIGYNYTFDKKILNQKKLYFSEALKTFARSFYPTTYYRWWKAGEKDVSPAYMALSALFDLHTFAHSKLETADIKRGNFGVTILNELFNIVKEDSLTSNPDFIPVEFMELTGQKPTINYREFKNQENVDKQLLVNFEMLPSMLIKGMKDFPSTYNRNQGKLLNEYNTNRALFLESEKWKKK
jgi:hypothetical protein